MSEAPVGSSRSPMATAAVGARAAQDSTDDSQPRQLVIQVPPWMLILPLIALALYYSWADGLLQKSPVAPLPITAPEPRAHPAVAAERRAVEEARAAAAQSAEGAWPLADAPPEGAMPERAATRAAEVPEARVEAARRAEVLRERKQAEARELAAARQDIEVIVYFTEWCPACRSVRAYLAERGIRSVEHDVEKDRRASARQRQLNPRRSVPTIDIEGQVLVGFNARKIEQAIDRAARSRIARLEQGL